jgi:hypothetical protein
MVGVGLRTVGARGLKDSNDCAGTCISLRSGMNRAKMNDQLCYETGGIVRHYEPGEQLIATAENQCAPTTTSVLD